MFNSTSSCQGRNIAFSLRSKKAIYINHTDLFFFYFFFLKKSVIGQNKNYLYSRASGRARFSLMMCPSYVTYDAYSYDQEHFTLVFLYYYLVIYLSFILLLYFLCTLYEGVLRLLFN